MKTRISNLIKKHAELILYGFFGILTVLVNTVTFSVLSLLFSNEIIANTIAFFIAVQFAYFTNTKFVFKEAFTKQNFLQFWGMRIGTLVIDNGGLWLLLKCNINTLLAKILVNIIIILLNYILSKFVIFKKKG